MTIPKKSGEEQPAIFGEFVWRTEDDALTAPSLDGSKKQNSLVHLKQEFVAKHLVDAHEFTETEVSRTTVVFGKIFSWPGLQPADQKLNRPAELINSYLTNGSALPLPLAGEFAIVHWNEQMQTLTLTTDPCSSRPLFYVANSRGVAFASDIQSLLVHCDNPDRLDPEMIDVFLSGYYHEPNGRTLVSEIQNVPPASVVKITRFGIQTEQYWLLKNAPNVRYRRKQEYFDQAKELLSQSVVRRTNTQTNLAAHLSGGLDSAAISAMAAKNSRERGLQTPLGYAWQPAIKPGAEVNIDQLNLELCKSAFDMQCINKQSTLESDLKFLTIDPVSFPFTSTLALEHMVAADAGSRSVDLLLSGWGGDQVFSYSGTAVKNADMSKYLLKLMRTSMPGGRKAFPSYGTGRTRSYSWKDAMYSTTRRRSVRGTQIDNFHAHWTPERLNSWSVLAAKHNFQYSFPMLDQQLLEFAVGIPPELYHDGSHGRILMREAVRGMVPGELLSQSVKNDPSRVENTINVYKKLFSHCRQLMEERMYDPVRASYLDVDRMIADLKAYENGGTIKYGIMMRALSFLKLSPALPKAPF